MKDRSARGMALSEVDFDGNKSGWQALDYKVFVRKDKVEEFSAGGIAMPEAARKQEEWNVSTGVIVSHGDLAFTDGRRDDGNLYVWGHKPQEGDRVIVKEFQGGRFVGDDGEAYMIFADKDVAGVKL